MAAPGAKELALQALKAARIDRKILTESPDCRGHSKPISAPVKASAPKQETMTMKTPEQRLRDGKKKLSAAKRARRANAKKAAAKSTTKPKNQKAAVKKSVKSAPRKAKAATPAAGKRETVTAEQVAKFICAPGGKTMAEITDYFGIAAHPMRAKIHRAKHVLGYVIEHKDGRYYGAAPEKTPDPLNV